MISDEKIIAMFNKNPRLRNHFEQLVTIAENPDGETMLADVAEERLIESLHELGSDLMHLWSESATHKASKMLEESNPNAMKDKKKE